MRNLPSPLRDIVNALNSRTFLLFVQFLQFHQSQLSELFQFLNLLEYFLLLLVLVVPDFFLRYRLAGQHDRLFGVVRELSLFIDVDVGEWVDNRSFAFAFLGEFDLRLITVLGLGQLGSEVFEVFGHFNCRKQHKLVVDFRVVAFISLIVYRLA